MRDVIGAQDLEQAAPDRPPRLPGRRRAWWLGACALAALAVAVAVEGSRVAPGVRVEGGGRARADGAGPTGGDVPAPSSAVRVAAPALRAALAARPLGGDTVRTATGARGAVRLEVRNGGAPLELQSLTAEVPGVRFVQLVPPNGVHLGTEERVALVLGFRIDDCAQLRRTGRLVLRVEQAGVQSEVGLTLTHDREAGTVRQVVLDRVLGACPV